MDLIKRIVRYMALIVLSPFKLIYYICDRADDSDTPRSVIFTVCGWFSAALTLIKMRPFTTGRWFLTALFFVFFSYMLIGTTYLIFKIFVTFFAHLTEAFADMFDDTYLILEKMPKLIDLNRLDIKKHEKKSIIIKKSCASNKNSNYVWKHEAKTTLDLAYFIDMDKTNNRVPFLRYIGD